MISDVSLLSGISELSVLIALFYITSFVLLPSHVALSVLSVSALGPFSRTSFSLKLHFSKGRLFCLALVFLFS